MNTGPQKVPAKLRRILQSHAPLCIALSGGQDSTTLLAAAVSAGAEPIAATVLSEFTAPEEARRAEALCRQLGVPWHPVTCGVLTTPGIAANPVDRCYLCKRKILGSLLDLACGEGRTVCDGTNTDDSPLDRPGCAALRELGVCSPFEEAGMGKTEIVALAHQLGVPIIPPSSCLATRIPFGEPLTAEKLERVAAAETLLRDRGITGILRVRLAADGGAVVEVEADEMQKAAAHLKKLEMFGFTRLRVAGYISGGAQRWKQTQQ